MSEMRVPDSCAKCMYDKQVHRVGDSEYLRRVKEIIDNRRPTDTSPYLVYLFNQVRDEMFGDSKSMADLKRKYNDMVLALEPEIRKTIETSENPIRTALQYARVGNYIDFGAMNSVDEDEFMRLLSDNQLSTNDEDAYKSLMDQISKAKTMLFITDNCGEIVLDKLFIEQLIRKFPELDITILVRGAEVLNDATMEDANYVGIDKVAKVIDNGYAIAGTIYDMLPKNARDIFDSADVIIAKGQGNYESLNGQGHHIFYSFLCKCDLFTSRFNVERLTGILYEE